MDDLDDIGGCPGEWEDNTEYEEGDQVSVAMTDEVSTPSSQSCFSPTPAPTSPTVSPTSNVSIFVQSQIIARICTYLVHILKKDTESHSHVLYHLSLHNHYLSQPTSSPSTSPTNVPSSSPTSNVSINMCVRNVSFLLYILLLESHIHILNHTAHFPANIEPESITRTSSFWTSARRACPS